ncbi:unnamed protein product [Schistocephalus solidus]|uniref:Sodium/hydrogen exchanger n=1 Tax=Schistocephalus solidus TaxID=70667 RepID=A0A183TAI9_SCHSO|nr:unnamed protein product [Schistocephalus solidus]
MRPGSYASLCPVTNHSGGHDELPTIALAAWKYEEVFIYLTFLLFILAVVLLKIAYHKIPLVATYLPESLLLIGVGLIFGAILRYTAAFCAFAEHLRLTPQLFFNVLLPPIVLESAYSLYNQKFAQILGPILIFACLGTVLNFLLIGGCLLAVDQAIGLGNPQLGLGFREYLLFASLIVAVDPVAVLAIFQDIGVDLSLYYLVFGESLLNDAVTVVLYNIMSAFVATEEVTSVQVFVGIGSFFTVSLGGAMIGLIHGVISCLLTRMSVASEGLLLLLISYLSYIVADMFAWSGIISIIVCGVLQAAYAFHNLTHLSVMLMKAALKQISAISEAVIFLLLGSEVFALNLQWHTGLTLAALFICLLVRTLVVFSLSAIINGCRLIDSKIEWTEQIIIGYGGLRGAVAFSLAILVNSNFLGNNGDLARDVIVTTTLTIILFTVAVMGTTMKPLVKLLRIRLDRGDKKTLFVTLNNSMLDNVLLFVEQLISRRGYNRIRHFFVKLDDRYIRPALQRNAVTHDKKILNTYEKMALKMHSEAISSHKPISTMIRIEDAEETADVLTPLLEDERPSDSVSSSEGDEMGVVLDPSILRHRDAARMQRRFTLATLSRDTTETRFRPPQHQLADWARAAQIVKVYRNQAHLAHAMDRYIKRQMSVSTSLDEPERASGATERRIRFARQHKEQRKSMPAKLGRALLKSRAKTEDPTTQI